MSGLAAPSGFFVLRVPLLPFEVLESWLAGLEAPPLGGDPEDLDRALATVREGLRARLAGILERPEVREALFVASPSLSEGLDLWRRDPDGRKGRRAEEALVRYLVRMAARPTPFGLCAGWTTGEVGTGTHLAPAPLSGCRRRTRLDVDYLYALSEALERDRRLRRLLTYRPNSGLYRASGRLRYAETWVVGRARSYPLVAVDAADYLEETLERARGGALALDLARALVEDDPDGEVSLDEAQEFVDELIDAGLLVSELAPAVTGREPIHEAIERYECHPPTAAAGEVLRRTRAGLETLDAGGLGADPEVYRRLARELSALPVPAELPALFQVDMTRPGPARLDAAVCAEVGRALALLDRLPQSAGKKALGLFREALVARWGDAWVPLGEALDEEVGLDFGFSGNRPTEVSELLAGLTLPYTGLGPRQGTVPTWLYAKVQQALETGAREIVLGKADLGAPGSEGSSPPLPAALHVVASLAASSPAALARGDWKLHLKGLAGPSGARLLGRLCHADPDLRRHLEEHLRREEALEDDAVFAEVVHLPEGRPGNILSRPRLRTHEIVFLGRGAAGEEHQIPIDDLFVGVVDGRLELRSARLGRRVIPRLSAAHLWSASRQAIYRFLGELQNEGVRGGWMWDWGPLAGFPHLPRVSHGRLVLALERWRIEGAEVQALRRKRGGRRLHAVEAWRREHRLPRWVVFDDGRTELPVDLDNLLQLDAFLAAAARVGKWRPVHLTELFPGPGELCAQGPEGRYVHELVIPFERPPRTREDERPRAGSGLRPGAPGIRRSFPPGSEWLEARLHAGPAAAELVLREAVAPLVREVMAEGLASSWSFLRAERPDRHLRLCFHGEPGRLHGEVLPRLRESVAPHFEEGRVRRFTLDTYEREVDRYGGPAGVEIAEGIAAVDSEAALALVELLADDEGSELRWRLALGGTFALLDDLGLDPAVRPAVLERLKTAVSAEVGAGRDLRGQLAKLARRRHRDLEDLLEGDRSAHPLAPGWALLERRSRRLEPLVAALRDRERAGHLGLPVARLAESFLRASNNRLLRSETATHELVLYDLARRWLRRPRSASSKRHPASPR